MIKGIIKSFSRIQLICSKPRLVKVKLKTEFFVCLALVVMFFLAVFSLKGETITNDEVVHLPAGYSYITHFDYRMNPEHPPLLKIFSGLPLLFVKVNFPYTAAFQNSDQWTWGYQFLFESGNNADLLIFLGKIPPILLLLLLGWYLFLWSKKLFSEKIALFTVLIYSFSPVFLAHGRFVTTDVAVACFGFITLYYFWLFLKEKNKKNFFTSNFWKFALAMTITFLVKFSAPAIVLILILASVLHVLATEKELKFKEFKKVFLAVFWGGVISFLGICLVYFIFTFNLPKDVALKFIDKEIHYGFLIIPASYFVNFLKFAVGIPILKGIAWYFMGMAMVFAHTAGGHTTYFLGEIANGWWYYFPVIFNLKSTFVTLIIFYTILILIFQKIFKYLKDVIWLKGSLQKLLKENFDLFYLFIPVFVFFFLGFKSRLNLGIRYLLPIYPFIYTSFGFAIFYLAFVFRKRISKSLFLRFITIGFVIWQFLSAILIFPYFLAFYNSLAGGANNGYKYAVDSNLDWGQDIKRLKIYMDEHNINKIYLSYFGKSSPEYYGINYEVLYPDMEGKIRGFVAISATNLQGASKMVDNKRIPEFEWLKKYPLVDKIGYSIFIYNVR